MYVYLKTVPFSLQGRMTADKKYRIIKSMELGFVIKNDNEVKQAFFWSELPWNIYEPTPIYQTPELVDLLDQIKSYQDAEPFLTEFETECYKGLLVKLNEYLQKVR